MLLLLIGIFLSAHPSHAADIAVDDLYDQSYYSNRVQIGNPLVILPKGTVESPSLFIYTSTADRLDYNIKGASGNYQSTGSYGLGVRYLSVRPQGLGHAFGASYEFPRPAYKTSGSSLTVSDFSFVTFDANLTFGLNQNFFLIGGINYPLVFNTTYESDLGSSNVTGRVGAQAGLGLNLTESFSVEASYRTINLNVASNTVTYDYSKLWGFLVTLGYNDL